MMVSSGMSHTQKKGKKFSVESKRDTHTNSVNDNISNVRDGAFFY